jgi:hypothetical protein
MRGSATRVTGKPWHHGRRIATFGVGACHHVEW